MTDLVSWHMWHYNGRLRLVAASRIVYDRALGPEDIEIEFRIKNICLGLGRCQLEEELPLGPRGATRFQVLSNVGGRLEDLFSGNFQDTDRRAVEPRVRSNLYDLNNGSPLDLKEYSRSTRIQVRCTAQRIMRWMLLRPIGFSPQSTSCDFEFEVMNDKLESSARLADLLGRSPTILNKNWGQAMESSEIYIEAFEEDLENLPPDKEWSRDERRQIPAAHPDLASRLYETIIQSFPILADLLNKVRADCRCLNCEDQVIAADWASHARPGDHRQAKVMTGGCLQYETFSDVMKLLAHGIADAFGADDVSPNNSRSMDVYNIAELLHHMTSAKVIKWEEWFEVAAMVFCGCPAFSTIERETRQPKKAIFEETTTSTIAVQYGSLAVVAPWLDLSQELDWRRSLRFTCVRGRLCIDSAIHERLEGVEGEFVIIQSWPTEDTAGTNIYSPRVIQDSIISLTQDMDPLGSDVFMTDSGSGIYVLLLRVQSKEHSRLIDPCRAMLKLSQHRLRVSCPHNENMENTSRINDTNLWQISFDGLIGFKSERSSSLGRHPNEYSRATAMLSPLNVHPPSQREPQAMLLTTNVLDSWAKVNVSLALAKDMFVIYNDRSRCCLTCAIAQAMEASQIRDSRIEQSCLLLTFSSKITKNDDLFQRRRDVAGGLLAT